MTSLTDAAPSRMAAGLVAPAFDAARAAAHRSGELLGSETVPVRRAHRRVLAVDVRACTDLPPFASSAMDGWAVSGAGPWVVTGAVLAGALPSMTLSPGQAVAIATGAVIPAGSTAVVRREDGTTVGALLTADAAAGRHIRPAGEEAARGTVLLSAGTVLGPAHLGVAAAAGADVLEVVRRPVARLLVLGDELLDRGLPRAGRIRDSLGPQLPAWLERLGVDCVGVDRVADTLDAHVDAIEAIAEADLVVTTGGTAAGPADHLHRAVADVGGTLVVDSVSVRPGHPMLLARLPGRRWLLGLPGNPQSAVAALLTLGVPLVTALLGEPLPELVPMTSDVALMAPPTATRLVLATLASGTAVPTDHHGSGMLRGLAVADGYAVVPPGGALPGEPLRWLPLPA
jgi:molybdopterin molybdotransferase